MKNQVLLSAVLLTISAAAMAQTTVPAGSTGTPELIKRQGLQQQRVIQGAASNQLSKKEADLLRAQEKKMARRDAAAKADSVATKKEREQLNSEASKNDRMMLKQKHNQQKTLF